MAWTTLLWLLLMARPWEGADGETSCHINDLRVITVSLRELNTKTNKSFTAVNKDIENLKNSQLSSQRSISELNVKIEGLKKPDPTLRDYSTLLEREVSDIQMKTIESQEVLTAMSQEIKRLNNTAQDSNKAVATLQGSDEEVKREIEDIKKKFQDFVTEQNMDMENLQRSHLNSTDFIAALKQEIQTLKSKYVASQTTIVELTGEIQCLKQLTNDPRDSRDSISALTEEVENTNVLTQNFTAELNQEIEDLKTTTWIVGEILETLTNKTMVHQLLIDNLKCNQALRVAFIAKTPSNTPIQAGQRYVYTTVELNTNNAYDMTTGAFSVPVSGAYLFSVQVCPKGNAGVYYKVKTGGSVHAVGIEHALIETFHSGFIYGDECSSTTTVAVLDEHEEVWVESGGTLDYDDVDQSGDVDDGPGKHGWNMFSGFLINQVELP